MIPALKNPSAIWSKPAIRRAIRNVSMDPKDVMEFRTITAKPAAGPLTPNAEPLNDPTTIPPTIPAMIPENRGAPEASAIPRHNGTATKNTTILAGTSYLAFLNNFLMFLDYQYHLI